MALALSIAIMMWSGLAAQNHPRTVAIVGATLIDGTGSPPLVNATIVVRGDRITAVGTGLVVPPGATVVRAVGQWIIPGMIDTHVHFWESGRPGRQPGVADLGRWFPYDEEVAWMTERAPITLSRYPCSGVTSVVVLGAIPWEYELRAQADGMRRAPRVFVAGGVLANSPGQSVQWKGNSISNYVVVRPADVAPLLDSIAAARIDLVKAGVFVKRDGGIARGVEQQIRDFEPILQEIVRDSHSRGYRVAVHALELVSAKAALQAGADVLAHVVREPVDDAFVMLARERGVTVMSTLGLFSGDARLSKDTFSLEEPERNCGDPAVEGAWKRWVELPASVRRPLIPAWLSTAMNQQRVQLDNVKKLREAGVPIAVGSDGGNLGTQHGPGFQRELRLLSQAGFSPMEVIVAATRNGARAIGLEKELGTLQNGKLADLVFLDADPLHDVTNLDRVVQVMIRGEMMTRSDLNGRIQRH